MRSNFPRWLRTVSASMIGTILIAVGTTSEAQAAVLVAPSALATAEGNSNNAVPFTLHRGISKCSRLEFSSLPGPALISLISSALMRLLVGLLRLRFPIFRSAFLRHSPHLMG